MRNLIFTLILLFAPALQAQDFAVSGASNDPRAVNYNLGAEVNLSYPRLSLTNPDGSKAMYDGVGVRAGLNVPIFKRKKLRIYVNPMIKYLDLENTANNGNQYESANIVTGGAGINVHLWKLWFGARYNHVWGRSFASGAFADRANFNMGAIEYHGGLYFQFDRLGLGLNYSQMDAQISKNDTGLNSNTPYSETVYSLQLTFDMGASLLTILGSLF